MTKPLLPDDERGRLRHTNSSFGIAIALGLRDKQVWPGTFDVTAWRKRRTRNRLARRSRAINRRRG